MLLEAASGGTGCDLAVLARELVDTVLPVLCVLGQRPERDRDVERVPPGERRAAEAGADGFGSSETGLVGNKLHAAGDTSTAPRFTVNAQTNVLDDDGRSVIVARERAGVDW